MKQAKIALVVPARMQAVRLPNKPLADINGIPMVIRVARQAQKVAIGDVIIACAEPEIAQVAQDFGFTAVLTDPDLHSGTDRVYAAVKDKDYEYIINVQGDMPNILPETINATLQMLLQKNAVVTPIIKEQGINKSSPKFVKAIINQEGRALYFTRSPAPFGDEEYFHHIGVYGHTKETLTTFVKLPVSLLERREKLEQLRLLENNIPIWTVEVTHAPISIDTPEDLAYAREMVY